MNANRVVSRAALAFGLLLTLVSAGRAWADEPPAAAAETSEAQISRLVKELGDDSFRVREAAQKRLIEIGPAALPAVAEARQSGDPEVKNRAGEIHETLSRLAALRASSAMGENVVWTLSLDAAPSRVCVSEGVVLAASQDGLRAVDLATGRALWKFKAKAESGDRTVAGRTVYVPDGDGNLQALDLRTGKPVEGFKPQPVGGVVAVGEGLLYVGGSGNLLTIRDGRTNELKGEVELAAPVVLTPVLSGQYVCFLTADGKVHGLDRSTGKIKWSAHVSSQTVQAIAAGDKVVYVQADNRLQALAVDNGRRLWTASLFAKTLMTVGPMIQVLPGNAGGPPQTRVFVQESPLCVSGGTIYVTGGGPTAIDGASGKRLWEYSLPSRENNKAAAGDGLVNVVGQAVRVQVIVGPNGQKQIIQSTGRPWAGLLTGAAEAGGVVYFGSGEGLHALDAKTQELLWTLKTERPVCGTPIVVGDKLVFVEAGQNWPEAAAVAPGGLFVRTPAEQAPVPQAKDKQAAKLTVLKLPPPAVGETAK